MNRNHNKEIRKRIGAILLSLVVAVTMMPVFVFADDTTEAAVTEEGLAQVEEIVPESESAGVAGGADDEAAMLGQFVEKETADQIALNEGKQVKTKSVRGDRLRGNTRMYYNELVKGIADIADGNVSKAVITMDLKEVMDGSLSFTAADLGVSSLKVEGSFSPKAQQAFEEKFRCDIKPLYSALLYDLPYKLYWHDKTVSGGAFTFRVVSGKTGEPVNYYTNGTSVFFREADAPVVQFSFCVSMDYSTQGKTGTVDLDADKIAKAKVAAQNAADLITANRDVSSDYQKLVNYREYLCDNNVYNSAAVSSGSTVGYGDPWQMISVFDGDPDTNVVCEGYSKALQFLCDHTDFTSSIVECYSVSGRLDKNATRTGTSTNKNANHMWNIIRMNDGRYYMADITNCDGETDFAPDMLFLRGSAAGTPSDGYRFSGRNGNYLYYRYDEDTMSMFSYELELSSSDYGEEASADEEQLAADIRRQSDERSAADDAKEEESYNSRRAAAAAAENAIVEAARRAAEEAARIAAEEAARRHVHAYRATNYLDYVRYSCSGCGKSYTVSKVVVDLPRVTIKNPGRAKASFTAKWKKVSKKNRKKIGGIEIQYSTRRNFASAYTVKTAKKTATSKRFKKLGRKRTYYVRVRSYRWISGKKHVSAWSAVKTVKTK